VLGAVVERLIRRPRWKRRLANGFVFLVIVTSGLMLGGGMMYGLLMRAAATAPAEVLSEMMQPTFPFFIILNTPLERLLGAALSCRGLRQADSGPFSVVLVLPIAPL
jgi:hypothetical protein